jgi:excisionase family DNA binding protein
MNRTDKEIIGGMVAEAGLATKNILTLNEAAIFLGISKGYLYRLTSRKLIPFYKPNGKLVYFKRAELEKWITSNNKTEGGKR